MVGKHVRQQLNVSQGDVDARRLFDILMRIFVILRRTYMVLKISFLTNIFSCVEE